MYERVKRLIDECPGIPLIMLRFAGGPVVKYINGEKYLGVTLRCGWEEHVTIPGVTGTVYITEDQYNYLVLAEGYKVPHHTAILIIGPEWTSFRDAVRKLEEYVSKHG